MWWWSNITRESWEGTWIWIFGFFFNPTFNNNVWFLQLTISDISLYFCLHSRQLQNGDIISVDVSVSWRNKLILSTFIIAWRKNNKLRPCLLLGTIWKHFQFNVNCYVIFQVFIGGVHGDLCETYVLGSVDEQARRLTESCKQCLDAAIHICHPGTRFSWIGNTIR